MQRTDDEQLVLLLAALGQPNRLEVFRLVAQQPVRPWRPREVAEQLGMTYMTAHYHLTRLADAGAVVLMPGHGNGFRLKAGVMKLLQRIRA